MLIMSSFFVFTYLTPWTLRLTNKWVNFHSFSISRIKTITPPTVLTINVLLHLYEIKEKRNRLVLTVYLKYFFCNKKDLSSNEKFKKYTERFWTSELVCENASGFDSTQAQQAHAYSASTAIHAWMRWSKFTS